MSNPSIFNFGNRTAIVTGGSKNIGLAIAQTLLRAGMQVAIVSAKRQSLDEASERLAAFQSQLSTWVCDVAQPSAIEQILPQIYARHQSIDVLVNCAGILDLSAIEETTEATWDAVLDTNLKGTFFFTQQAIPFLKQATSPRIINISSNAGRMGGFANGMSYTASKGGMIALTYGLARKLAPDGITVNCVAPGTIESDMSRMRDEATHQALLQRFPIGRIGTADEVASAVAYFASLESGFTTGAVLDVNGGLFMG